jgi:hypothetical protein
MKRVRRKLPIAIGAAGAIAVRMDIGRVRRVGCFQFLTGEVAGLAGAAKGVTEKVKGDARRG